MKFPVHKLKNFITNTMSITQITKLALITMVIFSAVACKKNEVTPTLPELKADFDLLEDTIHVTAPTIFIGGEETRYSITFNMINKSIGATNYLWKFNTGDQTSTEINPAFTFHYLSEFENIDSGISYVLYRKEVKLTASNSTNAVSIKKYIYVYVHYTFGGAV